MPFTGGKNTKESEILVLYLHGCCTKSNYTTYATKVPFSLINTWIWEKTTFTEKYGIFFLFSENYIDLCII